MIAPLPQAFFPLIGNSLWQAYTAHMDWIDNTGKEGGFKILCMENGRMTLATHWMLI
jgi:hypothetical protein